MLEPKMLTHEELADIEDQWEDSHVVNELLAHIIYLTHNYGGSNSLGWCIPSEKPPTKVGRYIIVYAWPPKNPRDPKAWVGRSAPRKLAADWDGKLWVGIPAECSVLFWAKFPPLPEAYSYLQENLNGT